jgi:GNAT superfamily N-acetyltransferase
MKIQIRFGRKSDLSMYTKMLQKTYQNAYTNVKLGLTKDCFSIEVFNSQNNQNYLESNLYVNNHQKCWLAFENKELVGSISIIECENNYELRGFYVEPEHQGKGIGKRLWKLAKDYAKGRDITCDIYAHNTKTINIYQHWGFVIDSDRGEFYRHWPEWKEGISAKCIYMRFKNGKNKR